MSKIWNVNILLCRNANKEVSNIEDIFDTLIIDKEHKKANFTIVTILNSIESDEETFTLYYFIECIGKTENKVLYLFNSVISRYEGDCEKNLSSLCGISQKNSKMPIKNCFFPEEGSYEIKVYKYDGKQDTIRNSNGIVSTEEMLRYADVQHLVSVYPFRVQFE